MPVCSYAIECDLEREMPPMTTAYFTMNKVALARRRTLNARPFVYDHFCAPNCPIINASDAKLDVQRVLVVASEEESTFL